MLLHPLTRNAGTAADMEAHVASAAALELGLLQDHEPAAATTTEDLCAAAERKAQRRSYPIHGLDGPAHATVVTPPPPSTSQDDLTAETSMAPAPTPHLRAAGPSRSMQTSTTDARAADVTVAQALSALA